MVMSIKKIIPLIFLAEVGIGLLALSAFSQGIELKNLKGRIVFSSNRSGVWRIWIMNADSAGLKTITKGSDEENDVDPVFSPDGKSILFSSTRGGKVGIWKMTQEGANLERICDGDQAEWSPDARRIVFRRNEKIWIRDLTRQEEKLISPSDWPHGSGPAWSPEGKTLAFACRWEAGNALFTVGMDGGNPFKVYDQKGACEPHWSPDGKWLVYETETHICIIQPDGKKNRLITYYGGIQRYGRWSPDGNNLVYCQGMTETGPWELYVVSGGGGNPIRLTEGGSDMNPDWK